MRDRTELNLFFMNIFGARQLEMERRLEPLIFRDSRSRIVEFLYQLVFNKGQRVGYEGGPQLPYPPGNSQSDRHQPPDGDDKAE